MFCSLLYSKKQHFNEVFSCFLSSSNDSGFWLSWTLCGFEENIDHYCVLESEKTLKALLDLLSHLYMVDLWTESLKLINIIIQWLMCVYFTSAINEEKNLFLNRLQWNNLKSNCTISKAIKAMVIKINSKMKEWNFLNNSAERSAFKNVQCNLWRWRHKEII